MNGSNTAKRVLGLVSLVAMVAVADIGAASGRSVDEIANLSGPDRQKILIQGAKAEGELLWYTTLIVNQAARPIKKAFEKKYPFIKLDFIRAGSSKLVARLLAENRSKSYRAGVVIGSVAPALKKAGLVQPFRTPEAATYPKDYTDPDRTWQTIRVSYNGIGYNTKLVSAAAAPKTFEDLLDAKWKGKMVWGKSSATGAPLFITHTRMVMGEKKAMAYLKKLAKQNIVTIPGSIRSVLDRVVAGEHHIMISAALHHVAISAGKGAPIASTAFEPVIGRMGYVMIMKIAPQPHAAMLFVDFIVSEEGQNILGKAKYLPAHPKVDPLPKMQKIVPRFNGLKQNLMGPDKLGKERKKSRSIYKKLFK
jgi:ABC-type Fe3+ transport system substrate-binding protein